MLDFEGRVAIVTGGGQGLGRAYARVLAARGARVVVNDLPARAEEGAGLARVVVEEITDEGGKAVVAEASVITEAAEIVQSAIDNYGQLDILINNAGSTHHRMFEDLTPEQFWGQVDVHLKGGVEMCRAAWPHLKRSGTGRIVNAISAGIVGNPAISNYTAGKGGMLGFSRSIGQEGLEFGILVNCIFPNASTRLQSDMAQALQELLQRHFKPERVAAFVAWLVHQDTQVANEMFEVGGGVVSRLSFAHAPYVKAREDTPEAWAELGDAVLADGELRPVPNTLALLERELAVVCPEENVDLSKLLDDE